MKTGFVPPEKNTKMLLIPFCTNAFNVREKRSKIILETKDN
jgi:hypothetical protein